MEMTLPENQEGHFVCSFHYVKFGFVGQISNQYRRGRVARPVRICTESAGAETTPLHTRLESAIIFQRRRPSTIQYYLLSIICKGENLCQTNPNLFDKFFVYSYEQTKSTLVGALVIFDFAY